MCKEWPDDILLHAISQYPEMKDLFCFLLHVYAYLMGYVHMYVLMCVHVHVEARD